MQATTLEQRLEAVAKTRAEAAQTFCKVLSPFVQKKMPLSEARLRDMWLAEMRKNTDIYIDGWYLPPPSGIGILFATEEDYSRMNYQSLRYEDNHPRDDIFLNDKTGIIYVYASPVDRETGMIGDWGCTIYFGTNPLIQKHLQDCLKLNNQLFDYTKAGMSFSAIYAKARQLFSQEGLANQVTSSTDPTGVNIGHTIPAADVGWDHEEIAVFNAGNWPETLKLISNQRKFLNSAETYIVRPGAFTVEPRLVNPNQPNIPMSSYHTITIFKPDGSKQLLTDFDPLFNLVMPWMQLT